jgi:outer membrane protein assembly factor BamE
MKLVTIALMSVLTLSGCSSWVYKYDISQGNFLNQDDVNKLRKGMNKAQVEFVLGSALLASPFNSDSWHFVHTKKSGATDKTTRRQITVYFIDGKLDSISGDLEVPEDFNKSLDES